MSIYHTLVILLLLFSVLMRGGRKQNAAYILVAVALLFCVQGLRDGKTIGNDSRTSYRWQFFSVGEKEWNELGGLDDWFHSAEPEEETENEGWDGHERNFALRWFMKLVYDLTDGDYQWFLAVDSLFILFSVAYFIYRFSPSPVQSVLYYLGLLFYAFHFSAMKQSMAMSILLFSFAAIIDRKPIKFLILVVIASFFHFPALIFLPAYWIANMRIGKRYLMLLAAMFALTYVFRDQLVDLMTDTYDTVINANSTGRFFATKVIVMLVIIITAIIVRPPTPEDRVYSALLQLIGIAAVIQTFASYNNTFERLADYYFQFAIVFIPMVFERVETNRSYLSANDRNLLYSYGPYIFCAFAIWRYLDNFINDPHFYPYHFFFR